MLGAVVLGGVGGVTFEPPERPNMNQATTPASTRIAKMATIPTLLVLLLLLPSDMVNPPAEAAEEQWPTIAAAVARALDTPRTARAMPPEAPGIPRREHGTLGRESRGLPGALVQRIERISAKLAFLAGWAGPALSLRGRAPKAAQGDCASWAPQGIARARPPAPERPGTCTKRRARICAKFCARGRNPSAGEISCRLHRPVEAP